MEAIIIVIGNEVLSGETLDANSQFIGTALNNAGINVMMKITIPDEPAAIRESISQAFEKSGLIIMTGGLGPTKDDMTRNVIADYFHCKMVFNKEVFENIKELFKNRYPKLTQLNENQAYIPECAIPLHNRLGSAPGLVIERNNKILIALPGIPYEAENLVTEQVIPWLDRLIKTKCVVNRNIRTIGIPESYIANQIRDIEETLPSNIRLAYLPRLGQVKLRLTATGKNSKHLINELNPLIKSISDRLNTAVYGYDDEEFPACIGRLLRNENATLSLAESCTGGFISHLITSVPGSSDYFKGSITAYSNAIKVSNLGIDPQILEKFGAVSEENAKAMAEAALKHFNSDFSLATTGIAGPSGGTDEKPVGTLWMASAGRGKTSAKKIVFDRGRKQNIEFFSISAMNLLRRFILGIDV